MPIPAITMIVIGDLPLNDLFDPVRAEWKARAANARDPEWASFGPTAGTHSAMNLITAYLSTLMQGLVRLPKFPNRVLVDVTLEPILPVDLPGIYNLHVHLFAPFVEMLPKSLVPPA